MCSEAASMPDKFTYIVGMNSTLNENESTALQRFERSNTVDICNGIMFDFYLGLPHVHMFSRKHYYSLPCLRELGDIELSVSL